MVSVVTVLVIGFLLSVVVFAAGAVWLSLREEAHTPKTLRSDDEAENG